MVQIRFKIQSYKGIMICNGIFMKTECMRFENQGEGQIWLEQQTRVCNVDLERFITSYSIFWKTDI